MDVVTLHRHNEVDIKNINEDVAVSLVHDDDTLGATQIIDILSKLYRATFGCWIISISYYWDNVMITYNNRM